MYDLKRKFVDYFFILASFTQFIFNYMNHLAKLFK